MKTLFVALVALLFAFFLGCQSSITDPVLENTNYKDAVSYWPGVINFDTDICEPIHNTCNTTVIAGVIRYKIDKFTIPSATEPVNRKVSIYINATVKGLDAVWTVYGMSEEIVYLSNINEQVYIFDKEFAVRPTGHNFKLKLVVKFELDGKSVNLVSMELRLCNDIPIGDPEL